MARRSALAAALIAVLLPAAGITPAQTACTLCIDEAPRLEVGADGSATGLVELCHRGGEPVRLALRLSDFRMPTPGGGAEPLSLQTTRRISAASDADRGLVDGSTPLAGRCVTLRLEIAGFWQAGRASATLRQGQVALAELRAQRRQAPFGVRIDGPDPARVELRLVEGAAMVLKLHNDDAMSYPLRWRLELPGLTGGGELVLPPQRSATLEVPWPQTSPLSWLESGFLRSATRDGRLVVEYAPDDDARAHAWPRREFPVRATISRSGPVWQPVFSTLWIMGLLVAGIVTSLLVNYALPMQGRRVKLKHRLALLDGRLTGLGSVVPAQVLNLLRVEKRRLREELRGMMPVDPTTEERLRGLDTQVAALEQQLALTVAAGEHLDHLMRTPLLAVTEQDRGRALCDRIFEIVARVQVGDEDRQRALAALAEVATLRAAVWQPPSADAVQALIDRAEPLRKPPQPPTRRLHALLQSLLPLLPQKLEDTPDRSRYVDQAQALVQAETAQEFLRLLDGAPDATTQRRAQREADLLQALTPGPGYSLQRAREIVAEAEQCISPEDLAGALAPQAPAADGGRPPERPQLWIEVDPPTPLPYQLVKLRLRVHPPGLDEAVARSHIVCRWTIADVPVHADEWATTCFFEAGTARATIGAALEYQGQPLCSVPARTVVLEQPKSYALASTWLSLGSMAVTMLIVGIGLLAGAQEKIQTLDWVAGTVAILALGFGADVLKRVVTRP